MNSQIYKKYNWQCASAELAICTAHVERRRVEPRVLLHALCHYALQAKIILVDFNLTVSTQTTKPPNLIRPVKFSGYLNDGLKSEKYACG